MTHPTFEHEALAIEALDPERRREVLSAYLDGELSPEAARHVTAWLDDHPETLREAEHLRRVWDVLGLYADEPVPEGFASRTLARIGRVHPAAGRWGAVGLLAAAAAVLVAVGVALFSGRTAPVTPSEPEQVARVFEDVPPELLQDVDLLLTLSDDEFEGVLLADLSLAPR